MSVLELRRVGRHYPGSPPVIALDEVSLTVGEGELVGIVGPSGSGKSTLLNVIGTLDRPTVGQLLIENTPVAALSDASLAGLRASRIGFVFQQFHLLATMTSVANVATGLLYEGIPRRRRTELAIDALQRVGLGKRLDHKAAQLSGGERQRVAIARAIVADPAIVLADEPTGNLDSHTSADIMALLRQLNDDGSTIIVITHDPDIAASLPRRVSLCDGRVVGDERSSS
ncbi:MAG: ABC transporter ATP-binding protein [Actinomycetia bacterium]|nr:ABC transporter ATP-binding protein [Actinomycetes bacterium]